MKLIKAVCSCNNMSEEMKVLAVRCERFEFVKNWGVFNWLLATLMILATGGVWVGVILGWHVSDILSPGYACNKCGSYIPVSDFRD